jgi:hypothetical protein
VDVVPVAVAAVDVDMGAAVVVDMGAGGTVAVPPVVVLQQEWSVVLFPSRQEDQQLHKHHSGKSPPHAHALADLSNVTREAAIVLHAWMVGWMVA